MFVENNGKGFLSDSNLDGGTYFDNSGVNNRLTGLLTSTCSSTSTRCSDFSSTTDALEDML